MSRINTGTIIFRDLFKLKLDKRDLINGTNWLAECCCALDKKMLLISCSDNGDLSTRTAPNIC